MSPVTSASIDEYLTRTGVAIGNARETPAILAALEVYGYDDAVLQQGQDLLDAAFALSSAQRQEYAEQYGATAALNEGHAEADRLYSAHRQIAAIVFKNDITRLGTFELNQAKKQSFSGRLTQARYFYTKLLADDDAITAMGRFRITREQLEKGQSLTDETMALNKTQQKEKSEAQKATKDRDAALDELHEWMSEFKAIATIALADDPQLLEALQFGAIP
ncbi:hypothetical protein [Neptuniibacter sp.]|uniref:hypothetical protein n=1 Tax=Neptuniibacter sp. TaxID=1962643 RepID=UPI00261FC489|nr:hypothetical protein [Neptuniibacter sp.]MCP4598862.1 hypothetical protein [Neptuniibacter sp.]